MTHQLALSDEEYSALAAASAQSGEPIEQLVHEAIMSRYAPKSVHQIGSYQYPTGAVITEEEVTEMERLAQEIGSDRPWPSEMVIEDRGPR